MSFSSVARAARLLVVLVLLAVPAAAGTLYIPLVSPAEPGHGSYQTRIWLTNQGTGPVAVTTVGIPDGTDGTQMRDNPVRHRIEPGATVVLTPPPRPGLLEIQAPASVAVNAEMRNSQVPGLTQVFGTVPVIGSENVANGATTVVLQGVRRTTRGVLSHLGVVNLGHKPALCDIELRAVTGAVIGAAERLPIPALSHMPIEDVLELLGMEQTGDVHARISCTRPFYAYLAMTEAATGEMVFLEPSPTGASTLLPPSGQASNDPPADEPGTSGGGKSFVFASNGLVHSPTRQQPTWTHNIKVPANRNFSKVVLEMDVTPANWYAAEPNKMHNLFWLHRGGCCWPKYNENVIGYANAFGPGNGGNQIKVAHNLERSTRPFPKLKQSFQMQKGTTYRMRYVYDAAAGRVSLKLLSGGKLLFTSTGRATARKIRSDGSGEFMLYFGHTPHKKGSGYGPERPTYGWKYENVRVELFSV